MKTTPAEARAQWEAIAARLDAASLAILAAFPDRPMLEADVMQQSNGQWCVWAGKATRMRRIVRNQPTIEAARDAAIAKLQAE